MKSLIGILLAVWFGVIYFLGANEMFIQPPGVLPFPILIGVIVPVIVFVAAILISGTFKKFFLESDLRLLTAIQAWRAGGLGFLALYTHGILPGSFALPAGWGDIAIGITSPWVMLALIRRHNFATSRTFIGWNVLGLLDLVLAITMGALSSGLFPGLTGAITTTPMAALPLVFIPTYLVPLFVMLHITSLMQAKRRMRSGEFEQQEPTKLVA